MKVKELIEQLLKLNQDSEVGVKQPELKWTVSISEIDSSMQEKGFVVLVGEKMESDKQ